MSFCHLHLHTEYCLEPNVRLAYADLTWRPAGKVRVGDELIGFDEDLRPNTESGRGIGGSRMKRTIVEGVKIVRRNCYKITLENGTTIIASDKHSWVATNARKGSQIAPNGPVNYSRNSRKWVNTEDLIAGEAKLVLWAEPWDDPVGGDSLRELGWFAGMMDGEGWISSTNSQAGIAQNPGTVLEELLRLCGKYGWSIVGPRVQNDKSVCQMFTFAGYASALKMMGQCRPLRFNGRFDELWVGKKAGSKNTKPVLVTGVELFGEIETVAIQTSTNTLVAEGFLSHNSILDGNTPIVDVPAIVAEHGDESVAVTDHGSMGGSYKFVEACAEHGVKPILGMEGYITPDLSIKEKDTPIWHIVLLGSGEEGKRNLFTLSQIGWTDGFYKKPRIDHGVLDRYSRGIIATSSCMAGEVSRFIEAGEDGLALAALSNYKRILGDNFYVELQPGNAPELNHKLAELGESLGIKRVVSVDSHYSHCADKAYEELLLTMQQTGGAKGSDKEYASLMYDEAKKEENLLKRINMLWPNRGLRFDEHDLYIMDRAEIVERMNAQGFDGNELADVTLEIAEKCEGLSFKVGQVYLPNVGGVDANNMLKRLVREGLERKGLFDDEIYKERAKEELAILADKGFANYFLIVSDLIREARERDIYVGPGRGSAAGSLVSFALDITSIDPIKYNLLFFRFINAERNDYPDIDMDFEHERRDELKEYFREKYGEALSLGTYSIWKAKSLLRGIARALAIPLSEVNAVCKHFDNLAEFKKSEQTKSFRAKHPEIVPIMDKFVGQVQASGMHAAGVVIADRPMAHIVPIESRPNPEDKKTRVPVAAFDMGDAEAAGLIKYDFLGLTNLSVIHDCIRLVDERHGRLIDWEHLEPDDQNVLKMLAGGHTIGVFQMESAAYKKLLLAQGVDSFEDLVASNALVRPGAWLTVAKDYINRKHGRDEVTYPHPSVEEELKHTYGVYIYQEQVMQLAVKLGGFSWSEADKLRKIIGKKKDASEFQPFYEKWIRNAGELIGPEKADEMWHNFEAHSGYSFNRSHAVCYSYIGYVTAWLKYHYPTEYMYSLLKNEKKDTNKMTYLLEAKRLGIPILPPDVHESDHKMSIQGDGLRFGLSDIKNLGFAASKELIKKRPFEDWDDLVQRCEKKKVDSRVLESLQAVDALSSVAYAPRNSEPEKNYHSYLNYPIDLETVAELGIEFDEIGNYDEDSNEYIVVCGVTKNLKRTATYTRLDIEDMSGTVTVFGRDGNDLGNNEVIIGLVGEKNLSAYARVDGLAERIDMGTTTDMENFFVGDPWGEVNKLRKWGIDTFDQPKSLAMPVGIRRITTKKGDRMAWLTMWDGTDFVTAAAFPKTWEQVEKFFSPFKPVCVKLEYMDSGGFKVAWNGAADPVKILEKKEEMLNG